MPIALGAWLALGCTALGCTALGCTALGCTDQGEGRPDKDLGDLVISPVKTIPEVNIEEASQNPDALMVALGLPHTWVATSIGSHQVRGHTKVIVNEGDALLEELDDTLFLDIDGEDRFHLTLDNSKDYGRHAIFDGKSLYLRPRFGKYHARAPQSATEAADIRNEVFAGATDYLDLFAGQLEVSDQGATTLEGRAVRQITLKLAPTPKKNAAPARLTQRAWRDSIAVQAIEGQVSLDAESGAALAIEFQGSITYERDNRRFTMTLQATRSISKIGHDRAIAPPGDELVMRIPARRRELAERESLLKGIAPPARKAPTPKMRANSSPRRGK